MAIFYSPKKDKNIRKGIIMNEFLSKEFTEVFNYKNKEDLKQWSMFLDLTCDMDLNHSPKQSKKRKNNK